MRTSRTDEDRDLPGGRAGRRQRRRPGDDLIGGPEANKDGGERDDRQDPGRPVDGPLELAPDVRQPRRIDIVAKAARDHPDVSVEQPSRRVVDGKSPEEHQIGKEARPHQPGLRISGQRPERDVGEQVARLGGDEEQERARRDAEHADPTRKQDADHPKRDGAKPHGPLPMSSSALRTGAPRRAEPRSRPRLRPIPDASQRKGFVSTPAVLGIRMSLARTTTIVSPPPGSDRRRRPGRSPPRRGRRRRLEPETPPPVRPSGQGGPCRARRPCAAGCVRRSRRA